MQISPRWPIGRRRSGSSIEVISTSVPGSGRPIEPGARRAERVDRAHRAGLGQAVALDQRAAGQPLEGLLHRARQRRAAGDAKAQAGQVVLLEQLRAVDRRVHGRHAEQHGRPLLGDHLQQLIQAEARQQDDLEAAGERGVHHPGHAEHVEQRQRADHLLLAGPAADRPHRDLPGIGVERGVGEHGALGRAGGAAGVLQHRHVLARVDRDRRVFAVVGDQHLEPDVTRVGRHVGDLPAAQHREQRALAPGQQAAHGADHDGLQAGVGKAAGDLGIGRLDVERDHDRGVRIVDLARDLALGVQRIVVDHGAAGLEHREEADHVVGAIRQEQADAHARADAERLEALGRAVDQLADLAVARLAAEEVETGPVGEGRDRIVEQREQRARLEREVPGEAGRIMRLPGKRPDQGRVGRRLGRSRRRDRRSAEEIPQAQPANRPAGQDRGLVPLPHRVLYAHLRARRLRPLCPAGDDAAQRLNNTLCRRAAPAISRARRTR